MERRAEGREEGGERGARPLREDGYTIARTATSARTATGARTAAVRQQQPRPQHCGFIANAAGVTARPPCDVQRSSFGMARPTANTASIV